MNAIDTRTTYLLPALALAPNTNAQGEMLRSLVFDQSDGEYGCYTTFDTHPDFEEGDAAWRRKFWQTHSWPGCPWPSMDDADLDFIVSAGRGGEMVFADCYLHTCWFWDGDGDLAFIVSDHEGNILHEFLNTDCKKNYVWNIQR